MFKRIALIFAFVLASCTEQPNYFDWCYTYDFTQSDQGFNIQDGQWVDGLGFLTDESGLLIVNFTHDRDLTPNSASITVRTFYDDTPYNNTISANIDIFGFRTEINSFFVPVNDVLIFEYELAGNLPGAPMQSEINAVVDATAPIYVQALTVRGLGGTPFETNPCSPDYDPDNPTPAPTTSGVPPTPTPFAIDTLPPSWTPTPSNTPTPNATNTPNPSITPTPSPTPSTWCYAYTGSELGSLWTESATADYGAAWNGTSWGRKIDSPTSAWLARSATIRRSWGSTHNVTRVEAHYTTSNDVSTTFFRTATDDGWETGVFSLNTTYQFYRRTINRNIDFVEFGFSRATVASALQFRISTVVLAGNGASPEGYSNCSISAPTPSPAPPTTAPTDTPAPSNTPTPNPTRTPLFTPLPATLTAIVVNTPTIIPPTLSPLPTNTPGPTNTPPPTRTLFFPPPIPFTSTFLPTATPNLTASATLDLTGTPTFPLPGGEDGEIDLLTAIAGIVAAIYATIVNLFNTLMEALSQFGAWLNGFLANLQIMLDGIIQAINAILEQLWRALQEFWEIVKLLVDIALRLLQLIVIWIGQMFARVGALLTSFFTAPLLPIPGLPLCYSAPSNHDICAIYYILDYTLLAQNTPGQVLVPLLLIIIDISILMYFARFVLRIVRRGERVTSVG